MTMDTMPKYTYGEIAVYREGDSYYWWDEPIWGEDLNQEDCTDILNERNAIGFHVCEKSVLYDNLDGYEDVIQNEASLPDGLYIVTYYWWDGRDLLQWCDYGVTKQQIVENVRNQKYREGADYFLMEGGNKP